MTAQLRQYLCPNLSVITDSSRCSTLSVLPSGACAPVVLSTNTFSVVIEGVFGFLPPMRYSNRVGQFAPLFAAIRPVVVQTYSPNTSGGFWGISDFFPSRRWLIISCQ